MDTPYKPVACSLWDEWELAILKGQIIDIRFTDAEGNVETISARPRDLFTREKAEYLKLEQDGETVEIRLDRLLTGTR